MLRPFALLHVVGSFCATIETSQTQFRSMCKRTQQLPTLVSVRFHDAFKNGSLLFSSLHVNEFGVGEQVVNWQTTSAWCLLR